VLDIVVLAVELAVVDMDVDADDVNDVVAVEDNDVDAVVVSDVDNDDDIVVDADVVTVELTDVVADDA
jgi:hypothetical protein